METNSEDNWQWKMTICSYDILRRKDKKKKIKNQIPTQITKKKKIHKCYMITIVILNWETPK